LSFLLVILCVEKQTKAEVASLAEVVNEQSKEKSVEMTNI